MCVCSFGDNVKVLCVLNSAVSQRGFCFGYMGMSGALKTKVWLRCLRIFCKDVRGERQESWKDHAEVLFAAQATCVR